MFNSIKKTMKTKQTLKKLVSPVSLFIFSLTFFGSIFIGYILNQNNELQISEIKNQWYEQSGDLESDKNFEELKVIKDNLEKIVEGLRRESYNDKFKSKIVSCRSKSPEQKTNINDKPNIDFPTQWKINKIYESFSEKVNYDNICNIGDFNLDVQKQDKSNRIAINFSEEILDGLKVKNSSDPKNSIKNLENYSDVLMQYFGKSSQKNQTNNYFQKFSSIKFLWVYIANAKNQMLSYPASEIQVPLNVKERPWWKFAQSHENKQLNITPPYVDINDSPNNNNIIRTIWYKFTVENIEYVIAVDLFFDSTQNLNGLDFLKRCFESASIINNGTLLPFIIQTFTLYLLLFFIYELYEAKFKYSSLQNTVPNSSGLIKLKLQRYDKHYAIKNADDIVITVQGETKETDTNENSREAGWTFSFPNLNFNQKNNQSNIKQNELVYTYVSTGKYNLDMTNNQPSYRCIEVWKVFLESRSGDIENLGFFVAGWNTTNSINLEDELNIKSINWEREYEHNLEVVKEQLYNHLSVSEEKEFIGILDYSSKNTVNVPQHLKRIDFIQKIIDNSLFLNQRKIILPENEIITEIYRLGTVRAICTRNFLQILVDSNKVEEFFKVPVEERYYIEHEEDDFKSFYESLNDSCKLFFKNTQSLFKIMVYQKNNDNIVKPEDDFCIVKIDGKPSIVAYTLTDNRYPNAGAWISWRNVDIEYYTELYRCQKDIAHRIEAINTYLKRYSL